MWIKRKLHQPILDRLFKGKAIIVIGARQVGKSTLFNDIRSSLDVPALNLNCDDPETRRLLNEISSGMLQALIAGNRVIMIDEAQRVDNIGLTMKRIVDGYPDVQLLVTGSSSLQLRDVVNEPLTGRKYEYMMYPVSTGEIVDSIGLPEANKMLESRLIYGSYPDVLTHGEDAKELLMNLSDSYLYKDILELDSVRRPGLLEKLLVALALQLGSEVSTNEVARTIGADSKTVDRYIDLLEKCFVVYRLNGFSRNLRNELRKSKKIYFYDNGIRNAVIQNFAPMAMRNDVGALWENFFITERIKFNAYRGHHCKPYFWRTINQQEIDYIEESDGVFSLFEMKWNPGKGKSAFPESFLKAYPIAQSTVITPQNYMEHLL